MGFAALLCNRAGNPKYDTITPTSRLGSRAADSEKLARAPSFRGEAGSDRAAEIEHTTSRHAK